MPQAKFSLSDSQMAFVSQHETWGFPDKSALVREALEEMKAKLDRARVQESARLYAEVYAEDETLRELTDSAIEGWPQ